MSLPTRARPKPLGYLLSGFPRLSETFILNEILELERQGINLVIFSLKKSKEVHIQTEYQSIRSPVIYVPERFDRRFLATTFRTAVSLLLNAPGRYVRVIAHFLLSGKKERYFSRLQSFLRWTWLCSQIQKYDITGLHAHFAHDPTTMAYWASQLLGCPYSFTGHAKDIYCYSQKWLKRKIHSAQFVVTCTNTNKQYFEQISGNGTPIYCVHHGIDLQKFHPSSQPQSGKPLILSVGRLVEKKGFSVLLQACSILRAERIEFECQIVGQGPLHEALQHQIEQLGLQDAVRLPGSLAHEKVLPLYRSADLFVLPCRVLENGDRDGIPNVILEAMAMALPVISTSVSAIPEVIEHGRSGLLVRPNRAEELAQAIQKLLADPHLASELGKNARQKILHAFELQRNVGALREVLLS
ncbi:MAG: glycosyltransferase family 4 protein [bacterium]